MAIARRLSLLLLLEALAVGALLLSLYPYRPATPAGWALLALLALPLLLAVELWGERLLGASFVVRLPRLVRIAYGALVLGGTVAVLFVAQQLLDGHLERWGGATDTPTRVVGLPL